MEPYSILSETRKIFKDRYCPWKLNQWTYNFTWPSRWLIREIMRGYDHCFIPQYRNQFYLLSKGKIVWGYLVQANINMFLAGGTNHPAVLVYSIDPTFNEHIHQLGGIAKYLFSLKDKALEHPEFSEVKVLADAITSETERLLNYKVPLALSQNKQIYYTTFMFDRKHLPGGCVTQSYFPILVAPKKTTAIMVLPSRYWPQKLQAAWHH